MPAFDFLFDVRPQSPIVEGEDGDDGNGDWGWKRRQGNATEIGYRSAQTRHTPVHNKQFKVTNTAEAQRLVRN